MQPELLRIGIHDRPSDPYLVARTADDGREDGAGSVISGETGLAHTGSIVHNQRRNIIVTHDDRLNEGPS